MKSNNQFVLVYSIYMCQMNLFRFSFEFWVLVKILLWITIENMIQCLNILCHFIEWTSFFYFQWQFIELGQPYQNAIFHPYANYERFPCLESKFFILIQENKTVLPPLTMSSRCVTRCTEPTKENHFVNIHINRRRALYNIFTVLEIAQHFCVRDCCRWKRLELKLCVRFVPWKKNILTVAQSSRARISAIISKLNWQLFWWKLFSADSSIGQRHWIFVVHVCVRCMLRSSYSRHSQQRLTYAHISFKCFCASIAIIQFLPSLCFPEDFGRCALLIFVLIRSRCGTEACFRQLCNAYLGKHGTHRLYVAHIHT